MKLGRNGIVLDAAAWNEAHRYTMRTRDIHMVLEMTANAIIEGRASIYRHRKTNEMAYGYQCGSLACNDIHGGFVLEAYPDLNFTHNDPSDRFIVTEAHVAPPMMAMEFQPEDVPMYTEIPADKQIEKLIRDISKARGPNVYKPDVNASQENFLICLMRAVTALRSGKAAIGLDVETGMTVVMSRCEDCDALHEALSMRVLPRGHADMKAHFEPIEHRLTPIIHELFEFGEVQGGTLH